MKPETNTMMKNVRRAALTMLLAVMTAVAAWAQDHPDFGTMKWNDDIEAYEINSVETLNDFVGYVNGSRNSEGVTFKMTKDIEYPHTSAWDDINSKENNFTPVTINFLGTFDGQGHTLSGIRIYDTDKNTHLGIFREVGTGSVIRGLTIADTRISSASLLTCIGGIVGYSHGAYYFPIINDCHVSSTVLLNIISECQYDGIGGIVGYAFGVKLTNCTSAVSITSKSSIINFLGGIAGIFSFGEMSNNLAIGANIPAANNADYRYYGAVVCGSPLYERENSTCRNNYYYNCTVAGVANATDVGCFCWDKGDEWYSVSDTPLDMDGARRAVAIHGAEGVSVALAPGSDRGMVYKNTVYGGVGESVTLTLGYTGDMKGKSFTDGNGNILQGNAIDGYTLVIDALTAGDITINVSQTDIAATEWTVGNGSKAKPYVISYPSELDLLAQRVNAGTDFSGKYFKLGSDIRYNPGADNNFTPIGISKKPFKGHFDGAGHTISGIRINRSSDIYVGLFGLIGSGAEVCNVTVDDAVIVALAGIGVITGHKENGALLSHNYYHNCTCTQTFYLEEDHWTRTSDIGCGMDLSVNAGSIDITADDGAVAVYRLSVAATVAITADVAVSHGTDRYCKAGTAVSLASATAAPEGYYYFYTVDGETNTSGEFTMGAADATVRLSPLTVIPFEGSGTEDDPYIVRYASQFNGASGLWEKNIGRYYKLVNDLIFPHETNWDDPNSTENNFIPIGSANRDRIFSEHFDGGGHTISGIRIYKDGTDEDEDCDVGLFRSGGTIQNLKLADTRITGYNNVGGIVGGYSNVSNCVVESNVAIHAVQPGSEYHGGVVGGTSSGSITNCVSHAKLTLKDGITASRYYGGVVGYCNGTMSHNLAIGVEVPATAETSYATYGAIAGQLGKDATADHNYYSRCTVGDMEDPSSAGVETGGGSSDLLSNYKVVKAHALTLDEGITITDDAISYDGKLYYPDLATVTLSGGLPGGTPGEGQTDGYIVKNSHRSMFIPKHGDAYRFLMPLDDATVSAARKAHPWTGSGTEADPYVITTTEGLDLLAMLTDVGNTFSDTYFKLGADIAYTPTAAWNTTERYANNYTPIGLTAIDGEVRSFCGHFDGAGHIVSGIRIYNDFYRVLARNQGLFGAIGSGAVVSRVNLADASMSGWVVGGIAGRNDGGTVTQCSVANNVAFYPVREPNFNYGLYFGGIVGLNHGGTVSYCTSSSYFRVPDGFNDRCAYGGIIGWGQIASTENIISHNLYIGGTIIGQKGNSISSVSDGLDHNYYALCTRNGVEDAKDMGIYNSDVTENDGAVYALGLTDDGTGNGERIAANAGKTVPVLLYKHTPWKDGDWCTLCLPFSLATLTGTPFNGLTVKELDTETAYDGHKTGLDGSTLYLNFKDATAIEAGKPYIVSTKADLLINTASEWDEFAQSVSSGKESYQGKTVRLTNDISVTTMVGTSSNKFKGTFDGNGHKLTVAYGTAGSYLTEQFAAPFRFVEGATVKNLHVAGDIYMNAKFAVGLIGDLSGNCTVSNCRSSVAIHSNVSGDGTHGGFLGVIRNGTTTMTNCLFDGKMLGANTTKCGGFAGWDEDGAKLIITNSLFAPTELTISDTGSMTFSRSSNSRNVTIDDSYYTKPLGTKQSAEAPESVSVLVILLGDGWTVSGSAAVPKMNNLDDFIYPLFNGATVANTPPASVGFEGGRFAGSYNTCRAAIAINGDANGYSAMSNTDLTALTDYLVGKTTTVPKISNVNGDTTVDIADVAKLIGILTSPRVVTTVKSNVAGISLGGLDGTR